MRCSLRAKIVCALLVPLLAFAAKASFGIVIPPGFTISNIGFTSSNGIESMGLADGVYEPSADGYVGTLNFDYDSPSSSTDYYVVYDVGYYDNSSGTWIDGVAQGAISIHANANESGSKSIDFYTGACPDGYYQINAYMATKTFDPVTATPLIGPIIGLLPPPTEPSPRPYRYPANGDDPIPDPQTDPGTYPGTPPPPTSGPVGPGTS